jgi:hypothetical protein
MRFVLKASGEPQASGSLIWCWRRKRWYRKSFPNQKFTIHRIRSEDTHGQ